jgi:hypothetical protein
MDDRSPCKGQTLKDANKPMSRIVNNTRSRLGTRMRAGRLGLRDAGDLSAILEKHAVPR